MWHAVESLSTSVTTHIRAILQQFLIISFQTLTDRQPKQYPPSTAIITR